MYLKFYHYTLEPLFTGTTATNSTCKSSTLSGIKSVPYLDGVYRHRGYV